MINYKCLKKAHNETMTLYAKLNEKKMLFVLGSEKHPTTVPRDKVSSVRLWFVDVHDNETCHWLSHVSFCTLTVLAVARNLQVSLIIITNTLYFLIFSI